MKHRIIPLFILSILVFLFYHDDAFSGKIYKWVDERGVVHFSDRQPAKKENVKGPIEEREIKESLQGEKEKDSEVKLPARSPIEYAINATFTIKGAKNMGTGFFVSSDGYAITCKHVIEGNWSHMAMLNDQTEFPIKIMSMSRKYDLALLLVATPQKTPYLSLRNPKTLIPGGRLFAIGTSAGLQATVTDGVFTGFRRRESTGERVIQFSAPINQGNSGGPLIDENGEVVGVVSWKYLMRRGVPVTGVGFAIPSVYLTEEYDTYLQ